ncbi:hypothetical protein Tcan_01803, partial [Toxocara canis]
LCSRRSGIKRSFLFNANGQPRREHAPRRPVLRAFSRALQLIDNLVRRALSSTYVSCYIRRSCPFAFEGLSRTKHHPNSLSALSFFANFFFRMRPLNVLVVLLVSANLPAAQQELLVGTLGSNHLSSC